MSPPPCAAAFLDVNNTKNTYLHMYPLQGPQPSLRDFLKNPRPHIPHLYLHLPLSPRPSPPSVPLSKGSPFPLHAEFFPASLGSVFILTQARRGRSSFRPLSQRVSVGLGPGDLCAPSSPPGRPGHSPASGSGLPEVLHLSGSPFPLRPTGGPPCPHPCSKQLFPAH